MTFLTFTLLLLTKSVLSCDLRDGGRGFCIPSADCEMIKRPNFVFYPDHFCSDDFTHICCDTQASRAGDELITTTEFSSIISSSNTHLENHKNYNLLNMDSCGKHGAADERRVANGNKAGVLEFPWVVLIGYPSRHGIKFGCGGSLISVNHVLTAAHCLINKRKKLANAVVIRLGEHTISSKKDCIIMNGEEIVCADPIQDISINSNDFIIHENFDNEDLKNDIALIHLREDAKINQNNINTICMPFNNLSVLPKKTVIGFGRTETSGPYTSDVLMKADVDLVDIDECSRELGIEDSVKKLDDRQICAGDSRDSCKGDSGSSLEGFGEIGRDVRKVQYGIVSFGSPCGSSEPGVYTKVQAYLPWILDNMKSDE